MAKADQIIELLRSHIQGDEKRFFAIAMQVAAHEAQQGHEKLAQELKTLIDLAKEKRTSITRSGSVVSLVQAKGELSYLLDVTYPEIKFKDLTLPKNTISRFNRIILEQRQQHSLSDYGLAARRKVLLFGPPGTGKTVTAAAFASELNLPLLTIRLDSLITRYMGETASKLKLVFDAMRNTKGVYFFDEFDAIGGDRNLTNDVGEIRRILNSFLQFMEQENSESMIIAATNNVHLLDAALFRRFDDVVNYNLPTSAQIRDLLTNRLATFKLGKISWPKITEAGKGMSHAEVVRASNNAAKETILSGALEISQSALLNAFQDISSSRY